MKRPIVIALLVAALLLVLAGIGATLFFAARSGSGNFFTGRTQPFATVEETKTLKLDAKNPVNLTVVDEAGAVTIVGADVESVEVKVVKTAHANTESAAKEEVKNLKYDIEQTGNNITLTYELPNVLADLNIDMVDFIVTIPNKAKVDIDSNLGDVSVANIEGGVHIQNDFGEISVDNVEGALSVSTNSGNVTAISIKAGRDAIDLHSDFGGITLEKANGGSITLDTNSGAVQLNEVRAAGKLTATTDFGEVTFENGSADSLNIDTNSGGVSLVKLTVRKEISVQDGFGNIELNQAGASGYDLHTNSGSITVDGIRGILTAQTDFGSISIVNAESVTLDLKTNSGSVKFNGSLGDGPHTVESDFGGIDLTLPADSKLDVDLKTDFGGIDSALPITMVTNGSSSTDNSNHIVGSINGGGAQLTIQTNSGGVNIYSSQ